MEKIEFKEIIELFLIRTVKEIKSDNVVPNINFKFNEDGIKLFEEVSNNPFKEQDYWSPDINQDDIEFLKNSMDDVLTIEVNDAYKFFNYLKDIVNESIKLYHEYNEKKFARNYAMYLLKHIWLRMGIEDFSNVNNFLDKQLQFVKNRKLDTKEKEYVTDNVIKQTIVNNVYDETTRSMVFTINEDDKTYELPHILYDIDDSNICYIYAVQSSKGNKDKKIERKLYKLNKGIINPNIHPSKVYSIILFINELKKNDITKIRVPSMQVLSYDYHEILSRQVYDNLKNIETKIKDKNNDITKEEYEYVLNMYNNMYEKQDKISYLKTEELINLIYRLTEHDPNIEILNDINIQGDYLDIKIK